MSDLLQIDGLVTRIHTARGVLTAVDGVSLRVREGECLGLVGESGSGKSMTAFSIMRLFPTAAARTEAGRVLFGGRDLLSLDAEAMRAVRGREIGMVFQDPATYLNPVLTVGEQVAEAWAMHHGWRAARDRAREALAQVGLAAPDEAVRRHPHELSGGMRQRVMIAQAIACRPRLLIADEPTTALDVTIQAQILDLLRHLKHELGMALLLITHDLGVVAEMCDTVAVMYAGRIVEAGSTERVFSQPGHPYTQGLLSSALSVYEARKIARAMEGAVPDLAAPPPGCRFHPRCPHAMPTCRVQDPRLFGLGPDHAAACWLHDAGVVAREGRA